MSGELTSYDFAVLRVVPHVHLGEFHAVGVVVHARTREFLDMRAITDAGELTRRIPDVDVPLLLRYLRAYQSICAGDAAAGPVALAPPSERFHWLTAPRSDVLQTSPVHGGLCGEPAEVLEELFTMYVLRY